MHKLVYNELIKILKSGKNFILIMILLILSIVFSFAASAEWESESRWYSHGGSEHSMYYDQVKAELDMGLIDPEEKPVRYARSRLFVEVYEEVKELAGDDMPRLVWTDDVLKETLLSSPDFQIAYFAETMPNGISDPDEYRWRYNLYEMDELTEAPKVSPELKAKAQARIDAAIQMIKEGDWHSYYEDQIKTLDDPDQILYYQDMLAHDDIPNSGSSRDYRWRRILLESDVRLRDLARYRIVNDIETYVAYIPEQSVLSLGMTVNPMDTPDEGVSEFWPRLARSLNALIVAGLISVVMAAGIIAKEYSAGTIKFLLINPRKRMKIFWSKYIAVLIYAAFMTALCFIFCFVMTGFFAGGYDLSAVFINIHGGQAHSSTPWLYIWVSMSDQILSILISTTLAFTLSAVCRNSGVAVGIGIAAELISQFLLVLGTRVLPVLTRAFPYANIKLMSIRYGTGILPYQSFTGAVLNLAIYVGILLWIARDAFVRKEV
ncbi:MAG: ABC transporter permease [Lachnospiraceae bacterium]|nr:ABC transporter permease [Lachnospiraceae bacterium]